GDRAERRGERLQLQQRLLEVAQHLVGTRRHELERERRAWGQEISGVCHGYFLREAANTVLRRSIALVMGPTPPTLGVIQPATSATDSSTPLTIFLPSMVTP